MRHANDVEEQKRQDKLIEQWKRANGYTEKSEDEQSASWSDVIKAIIMKPYIYIFLTLATVSPYGVQIIDKLMQFCGK